MSVSLGTAAPIVRTTPGGTLAGSAASRLRPPWPSATVTGARAGWLDLRRRGKSSQLARKAYYGSAPLRRRLMRQRDVLRPSGVRRTGD